MLGKKERKGAERAVGLSWVGAGFLLYVLTARGGCSCSPPRPLQVEADARDAQLTCAKADVLELTEKLQCNVLHVEASEGGGIELRP